MKCGKCGTNIPDGQPVFNIIQVETRLNIEVCQACMLQRYTGSKTPTASKAGRLLALLVISLFLVAGTGVVVFLAMRPTIANRLRGHWETVADGGGVTRPDGWKPERWEFDNGMVTVRPPGQQPYTQPFKIEVKHGEWILVTGPAGGNAYLFAIDNDVMQMQRLPQPYFQKDLKFTAPDQLKRVKH